METKSLEVSNINHHELMENAKTSLSGKYGTPISILLITIVAMVIVSLIPLVSIFTFLLSGPLSVGFAFFI